MDLDWKTIYRRKKRARALAEEILEECEIAAPPIDPHKVIGLEAPLLKACGADLGDLFDGQLEYHPAANRFLLFYNTKYDAYSAEGVHHPRTRFSIGHELGHYHLEEHHEFLRSGGKSHGSASEFSSTNIIEMEADSFSAGLLLPRKLLSPAVNKAELSFPRLVELSTMFQTSVMATAISCVQLSHFPCAIVAVREGRVVWQTISESLIEAGCYPKFGSLSPSSVAAFSDFSAGQPFEGRSGESRIGSWCETYGRTRLGNNCFCEAYFGVPIMKTLLVLLTADESDLT